MTLAAVVWEAPALRGLDARARGDLALAATRRELAGGAALFRAGDPADHLFVVERGALRVEDRSGGMLRRAGAGESVGEEALVLGFGSRLASAVAEEGATVVALPAPLLRRVWQRAGTGGHVAKLTRAMTRSALRDALSSSALRLSGDRLDVALDGARLLEVARGDVVVRGGEPRRGAYVIVDGLVRLEDARGAVVAHLRAGDVFRPIDPNARAVAAGAAWLAFLGGDALAATGLALRVDEVARGVEEAARAAHARVGDAERARALDDLGRLETGRSILVLDGDACVRCGHCASACAGAHADGRSRLVRRGPVVALGGFPAAILPASCQHCRAPSCLPACPTGAIERAADGRITLREDLCTGCGSCAKACPWENLAIAPRPGGGTEPTPGRSPDVAIKCDLCAGRADGPACVQACPTQALVRVDGRSALAEVGAALRVAEPAERTAPPARPRMGTTIATAAFAALALVALGRVGASVRLALGLVAAAGTIALVGYGVAKRAPAFARRVRWLRAPMIAQYNFHLLAGLVTLGAALGHASGGARGTLVARAALVAFGAASLAGALASAAYRALPRRLSRLSRAEWLPEEGAARARALSDRVIAELSGKSDLVKAVFARLLDPYRRSPVTFARLAFTTTTLDREEARLRAAVERALEGRGGERLDGLAPLVSAVVEERAFRVARAALAVLRAFLPIHVTATFVAVAFVVVHVLSEVLVR